MVTTYVVETVAEKDSLAAVGRRVVVTR